MRPFNLTVARSLNLTVIPDSDAHVNGHPVLTYSYTIYKNERGCSGGEISNKESHLHLENQNDPNYMGVIIFEAPDRLFTYQAGQQALSSNEVEEIIEQITHYRDTPAMWLI
jgi:hypothetical protein